MNNPSLSMKMRGSISNLHANAHDEHEEAKDHHDFTPKGHQQDQWRLTPSLLDPDSFAFASFANQPPGYYTPTPGGTNTLYHSQAGDLHTPSMGIGLGTPSSLPLSESGLHVNSAMDMHDFSDTSLQSHQFHPFHPFGSQQTFAPSQFHHQPTSFEPMDASAEASPTMNDIGLDTEMQHQSPARHFPSRYESLPNVFSSGPLEKFRYQVTLNAPTAMVKHANEVPVTYLNKGQAYSMNVVDTNPPPFSGGAPLQYRTFVRISFEDEQQRKRPAACWQLWKEGRGTNEAHQRGGKLQAVEFVEPTSGGDDTTRPPQVEMESASFDGFSLLWSPRSDQANECALAVRFNFLSTDFSHSKGVKGIPVRLCAKTELVSATAGSQQAPAEATEVCYCKVKLFRDHGAERKLSNDIAHVKKTIEKLKQQIAQAESGMKDSGKRKRSGSVAKMAGSSRPGKVPKHKRTWSMSSASSGGGRVPAEDDLHSKLASIHDMFTSTRPVSVLNLRGQEQDDPQLHPVQLAGELPDLAKLDSKDLVWDRQESAETSHAASVSSMLSPSSSTDVQTSALRSPPRRLNDWTSFQPMAPADLQSSNPQHLASPPDQPARVPKVQAEDHSGSQGWIEALGVDASYRPPAERPAKPVACLYVFRREAWSSSRDPYYRAVYLKARTVTELVNGIAAKYNLEPTRVLRTVRVNAKGLSILVDDDVVRQLPEGQDMIIEISDVKEKEPSSSSSGMKREWDSGATDVQIDGDFGIVDNIVESPGVELKLIF
ncbi:MAG: hypothetical protein M1837_004923 [Sclerophora amabilis]|nr:MAG: hypothetical protein M1837_004923 [Sclerophora amabilis]